MVANDPLASVQARGYADTMNMSRSAGAFVKRVVLQNYKSIESCDVELHALSLLVGPNGSGKSNFLDALRFVAESLRSTTDQALRERGGIREVRRRSRGHPTHFKIGLSLGLPQDDAAEYSFRVGAKQKGGFEIQEEVCRISSAAGVVKGEYVVQDGAVQSASFSPRPPASDQRLYLQIASGFPVFEVLYRSLTGMGFYNINPQQLRELQDPDSGDLLRRDGSNAASVLVALSMRDARIKQRIEAYLGQIVPGVVSVDRKVLGHKETIDFKQTVAGDQSPWSFTAQNMSDGTLRAFGVLIALFQCFDRPAAAPIPLVGIEEPEVALHPAAAGILMDALREGSQYTQVAVTSHSPELLDTKDLDPEALLVVDADRGRTVIARVDEASISSLRDRLFTAGELLKLDQLKPRQDTGSAASRRNGDDEDLPLFKGKS
ncbi:MAG: AAA family ATPase [Planctomycetota bacterium]